MPEGPTFRSFYSPDARAEIDRCLEQVCKDFHVPLVDARGWMPETAFFDSHHLLPPGAVTFTQRLEREVLNPLFADKVLAARSEL